jgi:hypothetical protein
LCKITEVILNNKYERMKKTGYQLVIKLTSLREEEKYGLMPDRIMQIM